MNKITKNYIFNIMYQILIIIIPLVTAPYLTRTLGANGTGIFGYINSTTSLITTFCLLGIFTYGNRQIAYYRDDKIKLNEIFWQLMSSRIILLIIATILYFIFILLNGEYIIYFIIYYTYILGYFIDCTWLFVGVEDMKWAVLKNFISKIIGTICIFVFIHGENDIWKYVFIQGISVLIGNIIGYSELKRYVGKPRFDLSNFKTDMKQCIILFLPTAAASLYLQCDKLMIAWITNSMSQISYYDYSEKLINIPLTFITVISTVIMPRIANEYKKDNKLIISSLLTQSAKISLWLAFPLMVGIILISNQFIPWYLGENFNGSITLLKILSPVVILSTLSGISGSQYFVATNQTKILCISQFSAAFFNIILNYFLINKYEYVGAAIATVLTCLILVIIQYSVFLKQIQLKGLFLESIKYSIFSILMYIFVYLITYNWISAWFTTMFQIFIGIIIYFMLCFIFKDKQFNFVLEKILNKFRRGIK